MKKKKSYTNCKWYWSAPAFTMFLYRKAGVLMSELLQVVNLKKTYGRGDSRTEALRGISFDAREGGFLGIMGLSGSGKTTLLSCIATMIRPGSGKHWIVFPPRSPEGRSSGPPRQEHGFPIRIFCLRMSRREHLTAKMQRR